MIPTFDEVDFILSKLFIFINATLKHRCRTAGPPTNGTHKASATCREDLASQENSHGPGKSSLCRAVARLPCCPPPALHRFRARAAAHHDADRADARLGLRPRVRCADRPHQALAHNLGNGVRPIRLGVAREDVVGLARVGRTARERTSRTSMVVRAGTFLSHAQRCIAVSAEPVGHRRAARVEGTWRHPANSRTECWCSWGHARRLWTLKRGTVESHAGKQTLWVADRPL